MKYKIFEDHSIGLNGCVECDSLGKPPTRCECGGLIHYSYREYEEDTVIFESCDTCDFKDEWVKVW